VILAGAAVHAANAAEFQVALTVEEPAAWSESPNRPAAGSAAGRHDPQEPTVRLVCRGSGGAGAGRTLVVDERGFLRWVLVDLQADLAGHAQAAYTLKAIRPTAVHPTPLTVRETAADVTIDTGKIVLTISKTKPFGLFESVRSAANPWAAPAWSRTPMASTAGNTWRQADQRRRRVRRTTADDRLRHRPVRRGRPKPAPLHRPHYRVARRSDVLVKYSLANSNEAHYAYRQVKDSSIELQFARARQGRWSGCPSRRIWRVTA